MFASKVTKIVDMESELGPVSVRVRKLSARALDHAEEVKQTAALAAAARLNAETLRSFREQFREAAEKREKKPEDQWAGYDRKAVLQAGVESWWSADPNVKLPPLSAGLEDLDEAAEEALFKAIMELSRPPAAVLEQEQKNG